MEADLQSRHSNTLTKENSDYRTVGFRGGILADSMGLGKSLSMISLFANDQSQADYIGSELTPNLLIVPSSLLQTWEDELERHLFPGALRYCKYHGPQRSSQNTRMLSYELVITTYDVVAIEWRNLDIGPKSLFSTYWRRIVLDEGKFIFKRILQKRHLTRAAHEIRAARTQRAKAVCALRGACRWAVTGTPIQNRWEDLAMLLFFLGGLPDESLRPLKVMLRSIVSNSNVRKMLAPICLRRSKKTIELPDRIDRIHKVAFDTKVAAQYKNLSRFITEDLCRKRETDQPLIYSNILAHINALRQLCNLGINYRTPPNKAVSCGENVPMMQESFEAMVSTGTAICSGCNADLSKEDEDTESLADEIPRFPAQLATCGDVLCGSCSAHLKTAAGDTNRDCQCRFSCQRFAVEFPKDTAVLNRSASMHLPVKMKALQEDLQAIPRSDKRYQIDSPLSCVILTGHSASCSRLGPPP